ncbi:hypothetical protein GALMADRAFT_213439 [Galerina marginata CBS 339.88]|uniref:Uncharacterized protein n=1 Tax=Galerina marginata (strain CBS 339.88) TaxID=685588 RepID=A0A067SM13_GALM3|nr:hypothetical protein GALMADRAFT_213439 [Galerina marginata CBS 339.88]
MFVRPPLPPLQFTRPEAPLLNAVDGAMMGNLRLDLVRIFLPTFVESVSTFPKVDNFWAHLSVKDQSRCCTHVNRGSTEYVNLSWPLCLVVYGYVFGKRPYVRPGINITAQDIVDHLKRRHLLWSSRRVEYWLSSTSYPVVAALEPFSELPHQDAISLKLQRRIKSSKNPSASPSPPQKSIITMAIKSCVTMALAFKSFITVTTALAFSTSSLTAGALEPLSELPSPSARKFFLTTALAFKSIATISHVLSSIFRLFYLPVYISLLFVYQEYLNQSIPHLYCKPCPIALVSAPSPGLEIPGHWVLEVTGYTPNGQRCIPLLVNNLTTFASVLDLLVAMRLIPRKDLGSFYLRHRVWGRTKPLSLSEKLSDKGVQRYPTLFLGLRVRGGSSRRHRSFVYVDVPPAPYPIPMTVDVSHPTPSTSNLLQQPSPSRHMPLQDRDANQRASKRKRAFDDDDGDKHELASNPKGKGKENSGVFVSKAKKQKTAEPASKPKTAGHSNRPRRRAALDPDYDVDAVMTDNLSDPDYNEDVMTRPRQTQRPTLTTPPLFFQPGCESETGRLVIVKKDGKGFYERDGKRCNHNLPSSWKDTDWSSRTQEAEFDEYDNSCLALEELNMCIYKPLNQVFCRPCQRLLDHTDLLYHLRRAPHNQFVPNIPRKKFDFLENWKRNRGDSKCVKHAFLVDHVIQAYSLKDTPFPIHDVVVHRPLAFMQAPQIYDRCPACKKAYLNKDKDLAVTKRSLAMHFSESSTCQNSPVVQTLQGTKWNPSQDKSWAPFARERVYGQLVAPGGVKFSQRILYFPEGWVPSAPISTAAAGPDNNSSKSNADANANDLPVVKEPIIVQDYVEKLGWDKAFQTHSGSETADLIDVWKVMLTSVPEHPNHSEEHLQKEAALERGLSNIRCFLLEYLQDANKYVKRCHDMFRRQITHMNDQGSIALLLRHRHVLACGKVDVGQRLRKGDKKEMQIDLHLSVEAKDAMNDIYAFLIKIKEDEEIVKNDLEIRVHRLLVGLLTSQTRAEVKAGSLFEFVTALKSYRGPEKGFGPANLPSGMCSMLTYGLRTIVVHVSRLRGGTAPYVKLTADEGKGDLLSAADASIHLPDPDDIPELEDLAEEEEEDDRIDGDDDGDVPEPDHINQALLQEMLRLATEADESATIAVSSDVAKPKDTDTKDNEDETIPDPYASDTTSDAPISNANPVDPFANMLQDDLLSALAKCSDWISNTTSKNGSMPTSFQRIKMIWLVVWPLALKAVGSTRVVSDEAGLIFKYSNSHVSDHDIELASLKDLVESLITKASSKLYALLPSGLAFKKLDISLSSLHDDMKSDKSIFEQKENKQLFDGLVQKFMEKLMDPEEERYLLGKSKPKTKQQKALQSWFDAEQELLETILGGMVLGTGIPARAFQMKGFRYASSSSAERMRNLFICKQNVVIGFPKSKLYSRTIQEALWALPPGLSQTLILYLGVIRPVSIELMKQEMHQKPRSWSTSHIFAPAHSPIWSWEKMVAVIKSQTRSGLKIRLSIREIRQLITGIFRKHLPSLIEPVDMSKTSMANKQADHVQVTSNQYGQAGGYMTGLCLPDTEVDNFLNVSHAWQALLGIRSPGQWIQALLHKLPTKELQDGNRRIAMDQVRIFLVDTYGLGGPDWERSRKVAQDKLEEQPFIPKEENNLLGDEVLVGVLAAMLYGHGRVDCSDSAPVRGLAVDTVVEAVAFIRLGLKEWTGVQKLHFKPLEVLGPIVQYKEKTRERMRELANKFKDDWTALGLRTFNHVKERDTSTNSLNLMDNQEAIPHERITMG